MVWAVAYSKDHAWPGSNGKLTYRGLQRSNHLEHGFSEQLTGYLIQVLTGNLHLDMGSFPYTDYPGWKGWALA
jgi:hypothetical protein